tara:strand:+ start:359 stop:676 length:318 start_codon:yes stop_codon:yes gene_type:complete
MENIKLKKTTKKKKWNIGKRKLNSIIIESINYLYFSNNSNKLSLQYICMNLNIVVKESGTVLTKNNKIRKINTYIREEYDGFENYFKTLKKKYSFEEETKIITLL